APGECAMGPATLQREAHAARPRTCHGVQRTALRGARACDHVIGRCRVWFADAARRRQPCVICGGRCRRTRPPAPPRLQSMEQGHLSAPVPPGASLSDRHGRTMTAASHGTMGACAASIELLAGAPSAVDHRGIRVDIIPGRGLGYPAGGSPGHGKVAAGLAGLRTAVVAVRMDPVLQVAAPVTCRRVPAALTPAAGARPYPWEAHVSNV